MDRDKAWRRDREEKAARKKAKRRKYERPKRRR